MANKGNQHGGNGKSAKTVHEIQDKFAEAVTSNLANLGKKPRTKAKEAMVDAGYSEKTNVGQVMNPSGAVFKKIQDALEKKGITADKVAEEYLEVLRLGKEAGARDLDLPSVVQALKGIAWLKTGGRTGQNPQVAVQINNGAQSAGGADAPADRELLSEIGRRLSALEELRELFTEAVGGGQSGDVHVENDGPAADGDGAHPGVAEAPGEAEEAAGGGQP